MIFTDKAAKEKIATLESRITELETDITAKDAAYEALTSDITAKDQTIAENVHLVAVRDEQILSLNEDLAAANSALESAALDLVEKDKAIAEAKESAGAKATEILATIGQPEPLAIDGANTLTKSLYDQYRDLKKSDPRAAAKFWEDNKAAMIAGQ